MEKKVSFIKRRRSEIMEKNVREENVSTFSYNIVRPLLRSNVDPRMYGHKIVTKWNVIAKGSKKLPVPYEISYEKIRSALFQIREHILRTPLTEDPFVHGDVKMFMKIESQQFTDSVKARGVVYTLLQLTDEQKCKGVIAISTGSFAYTLCYFGKKLRIPVIVVMPTSTAVDKIRKCQMHSNYLTTVLIKGSNMIEAHNVALCIAQKMGLFYLDGNDHPDMIIGQATLGIEIIEQMPDVETVILPTMINGCGLTTGIALAIKGWKQSIQIIEVHPKHTDPLVKDIRSLTNMPNELDIAITEQRWHLDFRGIPNCWLDKVITIKEKDYLNLSIDEAQKEEDEFTSVNAYTSAIFYVATYLGKFDELKGKRIVVPLYGQIDTINELIDERH